MIGTLVSMYLAARRAPSDPPPALHASPSVCKVLQHQETAAVHKPVCLTRFSSSSFTGKWRLTWSFQRDRRGLVGRHLGQHRRAGWDPSHLPPVATTLAHQAVFNATVDMFVPAWLVPLVLYKPPMKRNYLATRWITAIQTRQNSLEKLNERH